MEVEEDEPSRENFNDNRKLEYRKLGVLPGFKIASSSDYNMESTHDSTSTFHWISGKNLPVNPRFQLTHNSRRIPFRIRLCNLVDTCAQDAFLLTPNMFIFDPPVIPPDFEPFHKFEYPNGSVDKFAEAPPPEVPSPEDNSLRLLIDGFATLVVRCGKLFEDLSKEKNKSNPLFSFLSGGNGHSYYVRKLWEAKQREGNQKNLLDLKSVSSDRKMTAESRGRILGEKPLERSSKDSAAAVTPKEVVHLQSNLSDTFTQPAIVVDFTERAKPFKDDPAKQERFEKFLKDKYQGGLRSTYYGGTATMSESVRARERLDFEAAAEAIEKGKWNTNTNLTLTQQLAGDSRFVPSTGVEKQDTSQDEEKMITKFYPKREEFQWRPSPILCKRFDLIDPFMGKPPPAPRARSKMDTLIFMPDSVTSVKNAEADAPYNGSLSASQTQRQETGKQLSTEEPDSIVPDATCVQRPVDLYKAIFSDDSDDDDEVENASANKVDDFEKKTGGVNTTLNRLVAGDFLESLGRELGLEVPPDPTPSLINTNISRDKTIAATLDSDAKGAASKMSSAVANEVSPTDIPNDAKSKREDHDDSFSDPEEAKAAERKGHQSRKHKSRSRRHRSSSSSDSDSSSHRRHYDRTKSKSDIKDSASERSRKKSSHRSHKRSRSPSRYSRRGSDRDISEDEKKDRRSKDRRKHSRRKHH